MYEAINHDICARSLRATVYSQRDVRNWCQSLRSQRWLQADVLQCFDHLRKDSLELSASGQRLNGVDVVVGIPFLNGTLKTLPNVIHIVRAGLRQHFPELSAMTLVVGEADATTEIERMRTLQDELADDEDIMLMPIRKPTELLRGKGWSVRLMLEIASHVGAHLVLLDADLMSRSDVRSGERAGLAPDWIARLLQPILNHEAEYVVPTYYRHFSEARLTNPVCFPLVSAVFGRNIRQPIGGEFAIASSLVQRFRDFDDRIWLGGVGGYGVDVWLTTTALIWGRPVSTAQLGVKLQAMDAVLGVDGLLKDVFMFEQVVGTLFDQMALAMTAQEAVRPSRNAQVTRREDAEDAPVWLPEHTIQRDEIRDLHRRFQQHWASAVSHYREELPEDLFDRYQFIAGMSKYDGSATVSQELWAATMVSYLQQHIHDIERGEQNTRVASVPRQRA